MLRKQAARDSDLVSVKVLYWNSHAESELSELSTVQRRLYHEATLRVKVKVKLSLCLTKLYAFFDLGTTWR